jgi:hypothetical protein
MARILSILLLSKTPCKNDMKGINTNMIRRLTQPHLLLVIFLFASTRGAAENKVTRVYELKNVEVATVSRVINIVIRDASGRRVIGGDGKHLVISDVPEQQYAISMLLPVLDKPMEETNPDKIQMKMLMNASQYLRQQKIALKNASNPSSAPSVVSNSLSPSSTPNIAGGVGTYDKLTSSMAYKSIYASDDAKLLQSRRMFYDEPALPSLSNLQLKGIFKINSVSPVALLSYENLSYLARDGGLFENNHSRVKNVTSKVLKDRVILVGPDRIPREIKFKSSL